MSDARTLNSDLPIESSEVLGLFGCPSSLVASDPRKTSELLARVLSVCLHAVCPHAQIQYQPITYLLHSQSVKNPVSCRGDKGAF